MDVRVWRYDPDHRNILHDWLRARGLEIEELEELPEVGFMAYVDAEPVAAGFLRQISPVTAMLDSYITDPHMEGGKRHAALDALGKTLVDFARDIGIEKVLALTEHASIETRAHKLGFQSTSQRVLVMNL